MKWPHVHIRTAVNLGITAKKYYQRISKLELNNDADMNDAKKDNVGDDVDELNSRILKATQAPRALVRPTWLLPLKSSVCTYL